MGKRGVQFEGARWLVLLLPGVRRSDLGPTNAPTLHKHVLSQPPCTLDVPSPNTGAVAAFFDALPADTLRDRGLKLCRRTYTMRPEWQSDQVALDQLIQGNRRSLNATPDATFVWLRDAGRAAVRGGLGSPGHHQAIRDLDVQVSKLLQRLQRGGGGQTPPQIVALTLSPLAAVDRSFDLGRVLWRELPRNISTKIAVDATLSHARIRCPSIPVRKSLMSHLQRPAFGHHGVIADAELLDTTGYPRRQDEVVFLPRPGVALARGHVCAAPTFLPDEAAPCQATLPWRHEAGSRLSMQQLVEEFAEQATAQLRVVEKPEDADVSAAVADFPDLLAIMDPDVAKILSTLM